MYVVVETLVGDPARVIVYGPYVSQKDAEAAEGRFPWSRSTTGVAAAAVQTPPPH